MAILITGGMGHVGYETVRQALAAGHDVVAQYRNVFREFITVHRGTAGGGGTTRVGSDNLFMAYVHIAHDCEVGSYTIFGNGATLAGHVEVADWTTIGGFSGVHQFCRIGLHAFRGGATVARPRPRAARRPAAVHRRCGRLVRLRRGPPDRKRAAAPARSARVARCVVGDLPGDRATAIREVADVLDHLVVVMVTNGVAAAKVDAVPARRAGGAGR